MSDSKVLFKPLAPLASVGSTRIIGAIGEPKRYIATADRTRDRDAIKHMVQRRLADLSVGIAERTEFVNLILKNIRIYRSRAHAKFLGCTANFVGAGNAILEIPEHMECDGGARSRQRVDFSCIA